MAKNVIDAVIRRAAQASSQNASRTSTVGRGVVGYKKSYTQEEWNKIEAERTAMRDRLRAEG